jgi:hypothetical protein
MHHAFKLRAFFLFTTLSSFACTSNQDLGDRGDGGTSDVGDGDDMGDGDGESSGDKQNSDENPSDGQGPEDEEFEVGKFAAYTAASSGLTVPEFGDDIAVTVTSLEGTLGCALSANPNAAPGIEGSATIVAFRPESGESRCPAGVHAVINDPEFCKRGREGCALYRHWDAEGNLVAQVLGRGGYVSITSSEESEHSTRCDVEVNVNFAGGSVKKSFSFSFDPFAPTDDFCAN